LRRHVRAEDAFGGCTREMRGAGRPRDPEHHGAHHGRGQGPPTRSPGPDRCELVTSREAGPGIAGHAFAGSTDDRAGVARPRAGEGSSPIGWGVRARPTRGARRCKGLGTGRRRPQAVQALARPPAEPSGGGERIYEPGAWRHAGCASHPSCPCPLVPPAYPRCTTEHGSSTSTGVDSGLVRKLLRRAARRRTGVKGPGIPDDRAMEGNAVPAGTAIHFGSPRRSPSLVAAPRAA